MNIEMYRKQKQKNLESQPIYRKLCAQCTQPEFSCYCSDIKTFDPIINFVILIHPIEVKRRIATGRMSHLCLQNSYLIKGQDYSTHNEVQNLIDDSQFHSVILYPGQQSTNITSLSETQKINLFPKNKSLRIFVIDGTWATARKMIRSANLFSLPRICFTPEKPSNFRVRKQPHPNCYSTIEAIHQTIQLLGNSRGFDTTQCQHDNLITAFDAMVERQLKCIQNSTNPSYRREKNVS
jgi:DTW domain-containing protein